MDLFRTLFCCLVLAFLLLGSQGPHSDILMMGGGGGGGEGVSERGSYFIPQKILTSEFVYPK